MPSDGPQVLVVNRSATFLTLMREEHFAVTTTIDVSNAFVPIAAMQPAVLGTC